MIFKIIFSLQEEQTLERCWCETHFPSFKYVLKQNDELVKPFKKNLRFPKYNKKHISSEAILR